MGLIDSLCVFDWCWMLDVGWFFLLCVCVCVRNGGEMILSWA